jgi:hypothetical protein
VYDIFNDVQAKIQYLMPDQRLSVRLILASNQSILNKAILLSILIFDPASLGDVPSEEETTEGGTL